MSKSPKQKEIKGKGSVSSLFMLKRSSQEANPPATQSRSSMQKPAKVHDKYFLKSLHEEIDLYDRKLAHMAKYELFASDIERDTALGKMATKRATLAKTAKKLMEDGIEFQPSDLPRSFRLETQDSELVSVP
jgi:hypothetical protein